jgi:hypothetical protein
MALAVNGSGTIFKKCDRSNHRPDSNKGCASSICQHTCDTPERCQHAWTPRYWVNGKQVEKSFKDKQHPTTGRVVTAAARDWQLKLTVDIRETGPSRMLGTGPESSRVIRAERALCSPSEDRHRHRR